MEMVRDDVSEAEVVLRFLQAEIDKPNVKTVMTALGAPRSLIGDGDLRDSTENAPRAVLLRCHRGYPDLFLFSGFPSDVHWSLVRVTPDELFEFRYTRDVQEGARRLLAGEAKNATAQEFAARQHLPTALGSQIAVTDGTDCVFVEGHNRVTTLAMFPDHCPETLQIYLGRSYGFRRLVLVRLVHSATKHEQFARRSIGGGIVFEWLKPKTAVKTTGRLGLCPTRVLRAKRDDVDWPLVRRWIARKTNARPAPRRRTLRATASHWM